MPGSIFARPAAPGGMFGPRYGGVFGDADPLYSEMLARQAADQPGISSRIADWYRNSTFVRPAVEGVQSALTLPGDVYSGAQPTMVPDTGQGSTSPQLADRAGELAGMLTLGAGAVPAEANALRMGIKAYHGSPHDFEKFSMDKIGTGEGAQAYGHGLYFAENEGVAKDYQKTLADKFSSINRLRLAKEASADLGVSSKYLPDAILKHLEDGVPIDQVYFAMSKDPLVRGRSPEELDRAIEYVKAKFPEHAAVKGSMYQVDIAADPEHFLDWDKPLSEQSPKVREYLQSHPAVKRRVETQMKLLGEKGRDIKGDNAYAAITGWRRGVDLSAPPDASAKAAAELKQAGIPGIRYLDQGSRIAPQKRVQLERDLELAKLAGNESEIARLQSQLENPGTSNYVVFDDKLISVLKKYGLPISAAGAATLAQMHPGEAQAHDRR